MNTSVKKIVDKNCGQTVDRHTERQRQTYIRTYSQTDKDRERETDRQTKKDRQAKTDRQRQERQTETNKDR